MTLTEAQTLAAKLSGKRLERALATPIVLCRATDPSGQRRKYAVATGSTGRAYTITAADGCPCQSYQTRGWCRHTDALYLVLDARARFVGTGAPAPTPAAADRRCEDCGQPLGPTDTTVLCADCFAALMTLLEPGGDPVDVGALALAEVA